MLSGLQTPCLLPNVSNFDSAGTCQKQIVDAPAEIERGKKVFCVGACLEGGKCS